MSLFNFVSYHGYNFKLPEVTFVGPIQTLKVEHRSLYAFEVAAGGTTVAVANENQEIVESVRRSLLTSLAVDEPIDPMKLSKLNKFSKSIIRPEDEDYNKA